MRHAVTFTETEPEPIESYWSEAYTDADGVEHPREFVDMSGMRRVIVEGTCSICETRQTIMAEFAAAVTANLPWRKTAYRHTREAVLRRFGDGHAEHS